MEGLLILLVIIIGAVVPLSAILGLIGFFRARRALTQIEELERLVGQLQSRLIAAQPVTAETMPQPAAATEAQAQPQAAPIPPPAPAAAPEEELPEWVRASMPMRASVPQTSAADAPPPEFTQAAPAPAEPPRRRVDLEEALTLKWGVWLGGLALLAAGIFLVRYAVEEELLGPAARCVLAALLGAALIGAAEWLAQRSEPVSALPRIGGLGPDQAPPALAAGGVAILFGAAYGFGVYYELVSLPVAFIMLAAASFLGLAVSLRHGQLVAAIGIIGAFATPVLASSGKGSIPGLFGYLTFVVATALAVVRFRAWVWLGWSTTIAAALWVLMAAMAVEPADAWAPGLFVAAAAGLNLFLLPRAALEFRVGRALVWVPYAALGATGLILYLAQPGWAVRIGVLGLIPLAIWKGAREPALDRLPWLSVAFFLGTLLFWALPAWSPTGEIVATQEMIQAVLPGAWAPDVIQPLLFTAAIIAALYAAAGLWQERAAPRPLIWCALGAGVPPLTLAVTYAQVELFQPRPLWAVCAAALALAQAYAANRARREAAPWPLQRAGIHAAGTVASLCLGCAMILGDQWLTMAVALFLPALALIAEKAELPPLRWVGLAVAGLVLSRLLLNWYVLDYAFGGWPIVNTLLITYGVPAACFWYAATRFRRHADDMVVAVLEAGGAIFATLLVALQIRHFSHGGELARPGTGFQECALHVGSLAVLALVFQREAERQGRAMLHWAWRIQGGLALFGAGLLILANPMLGDARIDGPPVLNDLLLAYLLPAALAGFALTRPAIQAIPGLPQLLGIYALIAVFTWITLEVRHLFHPGRISLLFGPRVTDAELWSWSGAWLIYGIALMVAGIRFQLRAMRLAALAVIGITALKVFLIDMGELTGLWRVLSFLGLGLTLIGLGAVFRRFVAGTAPRDSHTP